MVADETRHSHLEVGVDTTGCVGEDHDLATFLDDLPDRVRCDLGTVTLVHVDSAREGGHRHTRNLRRVERTLVALDGRRRHPVDVSVGDRIAAHERLCERAEPRAEDDRDARCEAGGLADGPGHARTRSRTIGRGSISSRPISTAPSSAATAGSNRPGSSAWSSSKGSPSLTSSPGFLMHTTPALGLTGSSLRARPAPNLHAAIPTARASSLVSTPERSAMNSLLSEASGRSASGSPPV